MQAIKNFLNNTRIRNFNTLITWLHVYFILKVETWINLLFPLCCWIENIVVTHHADFCAWFPLLRRCFSTRLRLGEAPLSMLLCRRRRFLFVAFYYLLYGCLCRILSHICWSYLLLHLGVYGSRHIREKRSFKIKKYIP